MQNSLALAIDQSTDQRNGITVKSNQFSITQQPTKKRQEASRIEQTYKKKREQRSPNGLESWVHIWTQSTPHLNRCKPHVPTDCTIRFSTKKYVGKNIVPSHICRHKTVSVSRILLLSEKSRILIKKHQISSK